MCKVLLSTFPAVMFLFAGAISAEDASKQEHPASGAYRAMDRHCGSLWHAA